MNPEQSGFDGGKHHNEIAECGGGVACKTGEMLKAKRLENRKGCNTMQGSSESIR